MSAFPSSPAAQAPPRARLEEIPPRPKRSRTPIVAVVLILAVAAAWQFRVRQRNTTVPLTGVRTVKAVRGNLQRTLRVSGSISAKSYSNIFAPIVQAPDFGRGLVLISLATNGAFVKEGDVVAEIDGQSVKDHLDDVEAQVDQTALDLKRVLAQQQSRREALEQSIRAARAEWEKAQQDMKAANVKSDIQKEQLRLRLEEAQANYQEIRSELALLDERQAAEWRIAEIGQESQIRHRNRHRVDLNRFTVRAPRGGQVILRSLYRNGEQQQVRLGDEVYPGMAFMKIVDRNNMQLEGTVNQGDSELVRLGQKALIRFDAYPGLLVDGTVEAVGMMASYNRRPSYYVRSVPVRIGLESPDPRVIPDLTASADVVIGEQDDTVIIPREAIQESGGKSIVMVKQGETLAPREVSIAGFSNTQVAVASGLQEGDLIAIQLERP
jgi:multidrug efflux pump subunit AcrA (membrane-fusion protein)